LNSKQKKYNTLLAETNAYVSLRHNIRLTKYTTGIKKISMICLYPIPRRKKMFLGTCELITGT